MNAPLTFDALSFVRRLEAAGMERGVAEALNEIVSDTTATKADLKGMELKIATEIKAVASKIAELENRMMTRAGAMIAGSAALTIGILAAFITLN